MGRMQHPQAFQARAEQDQQKRRRKGGQNSSVKKQSCSAAGPGDKAGFDAALKAGVFIEPQRRFVFASCQQHDFVAAALPGGL